MAIPGKRSLPTFSLTGHIPVTVYRYAPSVESFGRLEKGERSILSIEGNVQPAKFSDLQLIPEADRTLEWIKFYSVAEVRTAKEGEGAYDADEIVWEGNVYRVMKARHYVMGVLDHYHVLAARRPISALGT